MFGGMMEEICTYIGQDGGAAMVAMASALAATDLRGP